jgi:transcriptional repressor NrdR
MVMAELRNLDQVAYVRFASVYRDFADAQAFVQEIDELRRPQSP